MNEKDIIDIVQLSRLIQKIDVCVSQIETGDMYYRVAYIERYPYFKGEGLSETRAQAIHDYMEMLILAFISACRFINDAKDDSSYEMVDGNIVLLNNVLDKRQVRIQLIPMAKAMSDLYYSTYNLLQRQGLYDYASHLQELRKRIFMSWTPIG